MDGLTAVVVMRVFKSNRRRRVVVSRHEVGDFGIPLGGHEFMHSELPIGFEGNQCGDEFVSVAGFGQVELASFESFGDFEIGWVFICFAEIFSNAFNAG